jgi:EAL domain-containing protein (putative c-di-GMP-specific phosphodiesterase class I)
MTTPHRLELQAGEVLFSEGDAATTAYLIEAGEIEVSTTVRGHHLALSRLGPGELLGEMAVFDAGPRAATATAVVDSVLYAIGPDQVGERMAKTDPVVRALVESLLRRYRGMVDTYAAAAPRLARDASEEDGLLPRRQRAHRRLPEELAAGADREGVGKLRLESQLRDALQHRHLEVRYQPILHIAGGRIAGYEALIRWQHPEHGAVSPTELVALAEESGLIVPVGEYVFDTACDAVRRLVEAGASPSPFIAVNVSGRELLHPGLIERMVERVAAARVPRGSLRIEFTESQALDPARLQAAIDCCHRHDIAVALDDFGTGYSHLAQMHRYAFDTLKIDQAFTRALLTEARARPVIEAIIAMARALGAQIVAEGVESSAELAELRVLGCDFAQGFLIGAPQSLEGVLATVRCRVP